MIDRDRRVTQSSIALGAYDIESEKGRKIVTKNEILTTLKSAEPELRAKGVMRAALFGSQARGEARADSDIDIMVEIDPDGHMGLWEYAGLVSMLEEMFPVRVDVANRETLKSYVRPSAERDAIYAF